MARIKTKARDEEIRQIVIYVIVSPVDMRCYVGKTQKHAVGNHYKDHHILRNQSTKQMFLDAKERSLKPKMYRLEELETVEEDAFRYCVAWTKYFTEHGYKSLAPHKVNRYASDLLEKTQVIYDAIKSRALHTILCDEQLLMPKERQPVQTDSKKTAPTDTTVITFRVTKQDAEKISAAAEKKNWNVSEYCRAAAVDGCIVNVDFNPLWAYTRQVMGMKDMLSKMIWTIHETGNYSPQDLRNIQRMMDTMAVHTEKIQEEMTDILRKTQKKISAAKRDLR